MKRDSLPKPADLLPACNTALVMAVVVALTKNVAAVHSAGGEPPVSMSTVKFPASMNSSTVVCPINEVPVTLTLSVAVPRNSAFAVLLMMSACCAVVFSCPMVSVGNVSSAGPITMAVVDRMVKLDVFVLNVLSESLTPTVMFQVVAANQ